MHHDVALSRLAVCVLGGTGGLVGVARHLLHGRCHLVHGSGDLISLQALALDTGAGLLGHRGQFLRRTGQLAGDGADPADQVAQAAAGALQRIEQLTELVAARLPRLLGHIACADALGNAYRLGQRLRQLTHDQPADDQPQGYRQQRDGKQQGLLLAGFGAASFGLRLHDFIGVAVDAVEDFLHLLTRLHLSGDDGRQLAELADVGRHRVTQRLQVHAGCAGQLGIEPVDRRLQRAELLLQLLQRLLGLGHQIAAHHEAHHAVVLGDFTGLQADGCATSILMQDRRVRCAGPACLQRGDQRIRGVAGFDPAAAGLHLALPERRQIEETLAVILHVGGDRLQALQILWIAEFPLLLLHQFDDARDRLLHRFDMQRIAAGFETDLRVANPVGLIQQAGRTLRPVAAGDQRVHAVTADQGDGQGQRQNGGEAEGQFVADLESVHLSTFLDERKRAPMGARCG